MKKQLTSLMLLLSSVLAKETTEELNPDNKTQNESSLGVFWIVVLVLGVLVVILLVVLLVIKIVRRNKVQGDELKVHLLKGHELGRIEKRKVEVGNSVQGESHPFTFSDNLNPTFKV